MKNYAYLIYVDNLNNHNKFYEITQNDNGSIDINYGRVGEKTRTHHYSVGEKRFDELKQSKEDKGYRDHTALHSVMDNDVPQNEDLSYEPIKDSEIKALTDKLIKASLDFVSNNYSIKTQQITRKMVEEAENDISNLCNISKDSRNSVYQFNQRLIELFSDIPRKMSDVDSFLARTPADFGKIIEREQEMLDNIKGQLIQEKQGNTQKQGTVLDAYGLTVSEVSYRQEDEILTHLGKDYNDKDVERRFIKAYAVENDKTRKDYDKFRQDNGLKPRDCRLFYHGSKVENWFSIMKSGLSLNPNAKITGKMFGNGLYFASECRKSLNYMDTKGSHWNNGQRESGYIAVYSVALGKCYKPMGALPPSFDKKDLPQGCLSVFADKRQTCLQNDEYVVYDQSQCTIKYLLEMSKYDVRDLSFTLDRKALRSNLEPAFTSLSRTRRGVKAELSYDCLSDTAANEVMKKVYGDNPDIDKAFFEYDAVRDTIAFSALDYNDKPITVTNNITNDDKRFLCRELKKSFASRESEWKELVMQAENYRIDDTYYTKNNGLEPSVTPLKAKTDNLERD